MAAIKGIELKSLQEFETHRGIYYHGQLYFKRIKIGDFENKGDGGSTSVFIQKDFRKLFVERKKIYENEVLSKEITDEDFIEKLVTLAEYERIYKERNQTNPGTILIVAKKSSNESDFTNLSDLMPRFLFASDKKSEETISEQLSKEGYKQVEIFKCLKDFEQN